MLKKRWGWFALVTVLVLILILMIITRPNQTRQAQNRRPIRVVASLYFYGEAAQKVSGKYGQVHSMINNSAVDPHDFQPSIKQSQAVSQANFVIENGLGYDHWMDKMVAAGDHHPKVFKVGPDITHVSNGDNEHVWYKPGTMIHLTRQLERDFTQRDPAHKQYYEARAAAYIKQLRQQEKLMQTVKQGVHGSNRVAVSEPVFDYSLEAMGYRITDPHFAKAIEDGDDPSPHDISTIQNDIRGGKLSFFVENPQSSSKTVDNLTRLARQHHVPVISITETKPNHESFTEWMNKQYQQVLKAQRSE